MTKEEALKLLRSAGYPARLIHVKVEDAKEIADLLDPPKHPEPGSFVEWCGRGRDCAHGYRPGIAMVNGVLTQNALHLPWQQIEYRRVCTVTPPPLISWQPTDVAWHCYEHVAWLSHEEEPPLADARSGKHIMTITREEMEASDEVG